MNIRDTIRSKSIGHVILSSSLPGSLDDVKREVMQSLKDKEVEIVFSPKGEENWTTELVTLTHLDLDQIIVGFRRITSGIVD